MKKLAYLLLSLLIINPVFAKASFLPKSFKAIFVKKYLSTATGKEKKTGGVLEYKYPGQVKVTSKEQGSSTYVSNRKKSWYYTPPFMEGEEGSVTVKESGKDPLSPFFDALRLGMKSNNIYKVKKNKKHFQLVFDDKVKKRIGIASAKLFFSNKKVAFKNLEKIHLTSLGKKEEIYELSKLDLNVKYSKNHFTFKIPKNTRITK